PALRCGAERIMVVSLLHGSTPAVETDHLERKRIEAFPHLRYLAGKLINALLLDSVDYDLHVLERFNKLLDTLEDTLDPDELARVQRTLEESRGVSYRYVDTLTFRPGEDIGRVAADMARSSGRRSPSAWALTRLLQSGAFEDDLLSFLFFDGAFAEHLMALGRRDAAARSDEIRTFFRP
ncbi:MAG: hypothetical protein ACOC5B_04355, partial [Myxococcota bacterium]